MNNSFVDVCEHFQQMSGDCPWPAPFHHAFGIKHHQRGSVSQPNRPQLPPKTHCHIYINISFWYWSVEQYQKPKQTSLVVFARWQLVSCKFSQIDLQNIIVGHYIIFMHLTILTILYRQVGYADLVSKSCPNTLQASSHHLAIFRSPAEELLVLGCGFGRALFLGPYLLYPIMW